MKSKNLRFAGGMGYDLAAVLDLPEEGEPKAFAIFAHCFTCNKNLKSMVAIDKVLTSHGIAVLRFDFTGLGESGGDFSDTNLSANVADIVAAADFLGLEHRPPGLLIGHSFGGAAVVLAASRISSCKAVVTIASPADPEYTERLLAGNRSEIEARGEADVAIAGRMFRFKKQFLEDLAGADTWNTIRSLKKPLLVMHSSADTIVDIGHAYRIFSVAREPKSFVSLNPADHLLLKNEDARYAGEIIAAWAGRFL